MLAWQHLLVLLPWPVVTLCELLTRCSLRAIPCFLWRLSTARLFFVYMGSMSNQPSVWFSVVHSLCNTG
jgi:hypothetical protein